LVVRVGQGSASAAEILAGAIQDHDMGLIVGTPTWGKGLVQTVYSLSYDAGLALTTAKYYTPSGRLIQRDYSSWFEYTTLANGTLDEYGEETDRGDVFTTDLGRKVYGGGGITPDVLIEPAELSADIQYLLSRNAFFDFSVQYTPTHAIENMDWQPPSEILDEFSSWLVGQADVSEEDIAEAMETESTRAAVLRYLRAEIFNSVFSLQARYQVLAEGDEQIRKALEVLEDASELLARRRDLDSAGNPGAAPAGAVG
ncbi:MAG: S41 family peptidase, partial [Acidobacteriota bacterium]|nr:S41 family peptidase [Acidobacteriota bacterium]